MSFDAPLPPYNASDPHARFLNVSCLDLLLIELVPMAERTARHVSAGMSSSPTGGEGRGGREEGTDGGTGTGGIGDGEDEERVRDAMYWRLDSLGYRVGLGLSERYACVLVLCVWTIYSTLGAGRERAEDNAVLTQLLLRASVDPDSLLLTAPSTFFQILPRPSSLH